jgi:tetrahydromethanopterin S-methyltransferase subunit G
MDSDRLLSDWELAEQLTQVDNLWPRMLQGSEDL